MAKKRFAKLVPKAPGADRELLFINIADARNVVPIVDSGEHAGYWVLVMPRAGFSLRKYLDASGGLLALPEAVEVLKDVCDALADLAGRVVHRDLKPENVLRLNGRWCLADFGISRYVEATTAPDMQKLMREPDPCRPLIGMSGHHVACPVREPRYCGQARRPEDKRRLHY
jgi:eukaryotic-like serine/threonine-protein kinase